MTEMPMTSTEIYDAWQERINGQDSPAFDRMLEQLRSGLLVMQFTQWGSIIKPGPCPACNHPHPWPIRCGAPTDDCPCECLMPTF